MRIGVLAQHHHPGVGVDLAGVGGGADALVRVGGRHADVGEDDVGLLGLDGCHQRVEILTDRHHFHAFFRLEKPDHTFADEVIVFGERDSNGHRQVSGASFSS